MHVHASLEIEAATRHIHMLALVAAAAALTLRPAAPLVRHNAASSPSKTDMSVTLCSP